MKPIVCRIMIIVRFVFIFVLGILITIPVNAQEGEDPPKSAATPSPILTIPDSDFVPDTPLSTFLYLPFVTGDNLSSVQPDLLELVELDVELAIDAEIVIDTANKTISSDHILADQQAPPFPGMEASDPESIVKEQDLDSVLHDSTVVAPSAVESWSLIMTEGFEGIFPPGGSSWRILDANGRTNGEYFWDDTSFKPRTGRWSAWPARGGVNSLNPATSNYQNNMRSWMIYGPFSLSSATDAELLFSYWNQSEANYDRLFWGASVNGTNFYGSAVSGNSGGWRNVNFDLRDVPILGNLTGRSSVWIAFSFTSDGSITRKGPFIDDIRLWRFVRR